MAQLSRGYQGPVLCFLPPKYRPALTTMASTRSTSGILSLSIEAPTPTNPHKREASKQHSRHSMSIEIPSAQRAEVERDVEGPSEAGVPPTHDNCDENHHSTDPTITISATSKLAGQMVAPFLAKHIPEQYAPLGVQSNLAKAAKEKDPNTKYCYRHLPDSKCRRTADEPRMENLQRVGLLL